MIAIELLFARKTKKSTNKKKKVYYLAKIKKFLTQNFKQF